MPVQAPSLLHSLFFTPLNNMQLASLPQNSALGKIKELTTSEITPGGETITAPVIMPGESRESVIMPTCGSVDVTSKIPKRITYPVNWTLLCHSRAQLT